MELEIFEALTAANVPVDKARAAAESIKKEINDHYSLHAQQLATRGDLEQMKSDLTKQMMQIQADLTKWIIASLFAGMGAIAALVKVLQ